MENDKLVIFLYLLMRDELPIGKVENLLQHVEKAGNAQRALFSGEFLAAYAKEMAARLR
jgi:hypothetical protein